MRSFRHRAFMVAMAMILLLGLSGAGVVQAAQIPWQNPSGTTNDFTFDNGGTSDQLFVPAGTSPLVTPTGLSFFPSAFKAQSANGSGLPDSTGQEKKGPRNEFFYFNDEAGLTALRFDNWKL